MHGLIRLKEENVILCSRGEGGIPEVTSYMARDASRKNHLLITCVFRTRQLMRCTPRGLIASRCFSLYRVFFIYNFACCWFSLHCKTHKQRIKCIKVDYSLLFLPL